MGISTTSDQSKTYSASDMDGLWLVLQLVFVNIKMIG